MRLSTFFFEGEHSFNAAMRFAVTDGESILIELIENGNLLQARELTVGEYYTCSEGAIWLPDGGLVAESGGAEMPIFVVGIESRKVGFMKSDDGSLLGEVLARVLPWLLLFHLDAPNATICCGESISRKSYRKADCSLMAESACAR